MKNIYITKKNKSIENIYTEVTKSKLRAKGGDHKGRWKNQN